MNYFDCFQVRAKSEQLLLVSSLHALQEANMISCYLVKLPVNLAGGKVALS